jgi:hypothetical protein
LIEANIWFKPCLLDDAEPLFLLGEIAYIPTRMVGMLPARGCRIASEYVERFHSDAVGVGDIQTGACDPSGLAALWCIGWLDTIALTNSAVSTQRLIS